MKIERDCVSLQPKIHRYHKLIKEEQAAGKIYREGNRQVPLAIGKGSI